MKALPKVVKGSVNELSGKSIAPVVASIVAGVIAGASAPVFASSSTPTIAPTHSLVATDHSVQQPGSSVLLAKPSLDGQAFAAHYSHSSHASHSSHYSCTPGSTC
ncbi:hypothetical protein [Enterobacter wuhouensis]|uniref:hypothetical protein n=1 Tax=Enterobacter wuhouensis TaxID=2529381 RepID=UPI0021E5E2B2|nr:hypothetical protein [Enterobacter wuhouensis]MCV2532067.1 hypothetical protein [Enterobacter wuhouensis]